MACDKNLPQRRCVICRQKFHKKLLVRYITGSDGKFIYDEKQILPGRGWYHCTNSTCAAKFAEFRPYKRKKSRYAGKHGQGAL